MRILALSDLHGNLPDYSKYSSDLVCICGDISPLYIQNNTNEMYEWVQTQFKPWCMNLDTKKVLFISGNHDFVCERHSDYFKEEFSAMDKITYLEDSWYMFNGLYIYGTPWTKQFLTKKWAFMNEEEIIKKYFDLIPDKMDILLTHDAPFGYSDVLQDKDYTYATNNHIGSKALYDCVKDKNLKLLLHGHLHSSSHYKEKMHDVDVYNCSILDEQYKVSYLPQLICL